MSEEEKTDETEESTLGVLVSVSQKEADAILTIVLGKKGLAAVVDTLMEKHTKILCEERRWWDAILKKYDLSPWINYTLNSSFTKIRLAKDSEIQ